MDILPQHFKDQGELLDVIDTSRAQGLSSYISLPQLVVCGDQSSGKSSVLEAISGVAFPTKDNLCTRFATEVVLRRDAKRSVYVSILPDADRPDEEKEELRAFEAPTANLADLPSLIETAKDKMGVNRNNKSFSKDILRLELSGPDQPHLTLVDLPGLIHAESKQQSAHDIEMVASLVRNYMANPRSLVLAVVSAKNDYANQIVTKFAREVDRKGIRTLGVITKPDMLHIGSESEAAYLELARNEDVQFRLGWHVLRNRDFDSKHWSLTERDNAEREFFSHGVWQTLPLQSLGVESLRPRLSNILKQQIIAELPELIRDIESGLADCHDRLQHLGDPRGTVHEQRLYLIRISESFTALLGCASNGVYDRDFFGDARTDRGFQKRLRAVVQYLLLDYAEIMRTDGHFEHIIDDSENNHSDDHAEKTLRALPGRRVSRSAYMEAVGELMRRTRGRELPGTFNPLIVGDLFFTQAQRWTNLIHEHMADIVAAARTTVELILAHVADASTTESLLREIINPALEGCVTKLQKKVEEVVRPHRRGHPITYNHYFADTIQRARKDHAKKQQSKILHAFLAKKPRAAAYGIVLEDTDIDKLLDALNPEIEGSMDRFACSEATYCMEAYYKVAMKTLVDNFAVLGVEFCLLEGLTDAFTAGTVMRLDDDVVQKIAAEDRESVAERVRTQEKLQILKDGLRTLNRYRRYKHKESGNEDAIDTDLLEQPDHTVAPPSPTIGVHEDVPGPAPEVSPGLNDNEFSGLDNDQELNHDPWSAFTPKSQKSASKGVSAKKSVKKRAAMFEDIV